MKIYVGSKTTNKNVKLRIHSFILRIKIHICNHILYYIGMYFCVLFLIGVFSVFSPLSIPILVITTIVILPLPSEVALKDSTILNQNFNSLIEFKKILL